MFVTRISHYIQHSVLSTVSCNRRSWNVQPVDTGAHLYSSKNNSTASHLALYFPQFDVMPEETYAFVNIQIISGNNKTQTAAPYMCNHNFRNKHYIFYHFSASKCYQFFPINIQQNMQTLKNRLRKRLLHCRLWQYKEQSTVKLLTAFGIRRVPNLIPNRLFTTTNLFRYQPLTIPNLITNTHCTNTSLNMNKLHNWI
jgi:hypothetical protein